MIKYIHYTLFAIEAAVIVVWVGYLVYVALEPKRIAWERERLARVEAREGTSLYPHSDAIQFQRLDPAVVVADGGAMSVNITEPMLKARCLNIMSCPKVDTLEVGKKYRYVLEVEEWSSPDAVLCYGEGNGGKESVQISGGSFGKGLKPGVYEREVAALPPKAAPGDSSAKPEYVYFDRAFIYLPANTTLRARFRIRLMPKE